MQTHTHSAAPRTTYATPRQSSRLAVKLPASCQLGESCIIGHILDWSAGGVFFCPENSYLEGRFLSGAEILRELDVGDQLAIALTEADGTPGRRLVLRVCWTGQSATHDCHGFGARFS